MTATPIIAGRAYRVQGFGLDLVVLARHPVPALCFAYALHLRTLVPGGGQ